MGALPNLIYYAGIARGAVLLVEHSDGEGELAQICTQTLERIASHHSRYNYTFRGRMVSCLIDDGFGFCAVIDEGLGTQDAFKFLGEVRDAFWKFLSWRGLPADGAGLPAMSLDVDFGPILKRLAAPYVGIPLQETGTPEEELQASQENAGTGQQGSGVLPSLALSSQSPSQETAALNVAGKKEKRDRKSSSSCGPLSPLRGNGRKHDKRKVKDHVTQSREIMIDNSSKQKGEALEVVVAGPSGSGELNPQMNGQALVRAKGHQQLAQRTWWRNVRLVLILDAVVCVILFSVWLGICKGFDCLTSGRS